MHVWKCHSHFLYSVQLICAKKRQEHPRTIDTPVNVIEKWLEFNTSREVREGRNQTCKELVDNNSLELVSDKKKNPKIQEAQRTQTRINAKAINQWKTTIPRHLIFRLHKNQRQQKMLKETWKELMISLYRSKNKNHFDLLVRIMHVFTPLWKWVF